MRLPSAKGNTSGLKQGRSRVPLAMNRTGIGSPRFEKSWRAPARKKEADCPSVDKLLLSSERHSTYGKLAQHATSLGDVFETRRRAAVNQRPAGSWEGYVWLPK